ncbi:MAG: transposase [Casimicrobium sp.]
MSRTPKRQFMHEYRAEAVKLVTAQGMKVSAGAQKLDLSMQTYATWVVRTR